MNSRRKGKTGELEAAHLLQKYGYDARRTAQVCGKDQADVEGVDGLHIEVKRQETVSIEKWMQQSEHDAQYTGGIPIVLHRRNREEWKVTLRADDFFKIWRNNDER